MQPKKVDLFNKMQQSFINRSFCPTDSVSDIGDIGFYVCSEIMRTKKFTIFTMYATILQRCYINFG